MIFSENRFPLFRIMLLAPVFTKIRSKLDLMRVRRTADLGGGLPSEVDARAFCRASKTGKVRAKLAKSAKCAAFMIFFRQNRDVV